MSSQFPRRNLYFILGGLVAVLLAWSMGAPKDFPAGRIISIPEGSGLQAISKELEADRLIRFPLWFRVTAILLGGERSMQAGEYYFASREWAPRIAWRIWRGDHRIKVVKTTIPEGFTVMEISQKFAPEEFPLFDHDVFEATAPEGYLFPDTYFFPVSSTASSTIAFMKENFGKKIEPLTPAILTSGHTLNEIVTMASLLEAEAKTEADRKMVADILWKRLKLGMPLQVDSEAGTYEFQGLPAEPINNPGLVSLNAAIHPTKTPYLYFLSDKQGMMHYAKNFDEHQANIAKYLR